MGVSGEHRARARAKMVSLIESLISADVLSRKRAGRNDLTRLPSVRALVRSLHRAAASGDKKSRRAAAKERTRAAAPFSAFRDSH